MLQVKNPCFFCVTMYLLICVPSFATTYYVAKNGVDNADGLSLETPWFSIQQAANTMVAGDTVYIREGEYEEEVAPINSGSVDNHIVYQAYENEDVVIKAPNTGLKSCIVLDNVTRHHLKFKNLTLDANGGNYGLFAETEEGNEQYEICLDNITIYGASEGYGILNDSLAGDGIHLSGNIYDVSIANCKIYNNNRGIYLVNGVEDSIIDNCEIYGNQWGIRLRPTTTPDRNIVIENNVVHNNTVHNISFFGSVGAEYLTITNNEVFGGSNSGIAVCGLNYKKVLIKNNYTYSNEGNGILVESYGVSATENSKVVVEDNICEYNGWTGVWIDDSDDVIVQNNIFRHNRYGMHISGSNRVIARFNQLYLNDNNSSQSGGIVISESVNRDVVDVIVVHNTVYKSGTGDNGGYSQVQIGYNPGAGLFEGIVFFNNISSEYNGEEYDLELRNGTYEFNYNCYYNSMGIELKYDGITGGWNDYHFTDGNEPDSISLNPLFVSTDSNHICLALAADSPCINAGRYLAYATNSGNSSTSLEVDDARYFSDGLGLGEGDLIQMGSTVVTITNVDYVTNVITIDAAATWSVNDPVSYPYAGSRPDMGVYEFYQVRNIQQNIEYSNIQDAIDNASQNDVIIVGPGTYNENISFGNKDITLTSIDPDNPAVAATTIINGGQSGSVVTFGGSETENCKLVGFTITNGLNTIGGGVNGNGTSAEISQCLFTENQASSSTNCYGGAIYYAIGLIDRCNFIDNRAASTGDNSYGGALANCGGTISNCIFSGNEASRGGGVSNWSCSPTISNCVFIGNHVSHYGGGIYNISSSSPEVSNCLFSDNSSGVFNYDNSNPAVTNCTFADNHGIGICNHAFSAPMITNCIIWGNDSSEIYNNSSSPVVTYCDVEGGYTGTGNINSDPHFVGIGGNPYSLNSDSPCIDSASGAEAPAKDVLGLGRNGDPDIGAYEFW